MRNLTRQHRIETEGAASRAPLAAAAALGVLAGGAAFLAFAMSRAPNVEAAPEAVTQAPAVTIAAAADAAPLAAMPDEEAIPAGTPSPDAIPASPQDAPPRLSPARIAKADAAAEEIVSADRLSAPRLKPAAGAPNASGAPAPVAAAAPAVLSLASLWVASEADRPAPFFFETDLAADKMFKVRADDRDLEARPHEARVILAKGETFVDALKRAGVRAEDRNEAALTFGKHYNLRRLLPGQEFALSVAEPNRTFFQALSEAEAPPAYLLSLAFRPDAEKTIRLERDHSGAFRGSEIETPLTTRVALIRGRIEGSLYMSAKKQGAPDDVIAGLAQMFAYDVDFQREIFGGDEFEALFEVKYDEAGNMVGSGDILYGRLNWRGRNKEKGYYRFADNDLRADYYDAAGESARRLLMKTPIDGARLSSGFGTRKHPILGYQKAHKGVDFAAARGTPIMAAGDGVIERAGPYGSFGNYVRIRHAQNYKTAYAHMNSIRKGIRTGVRVRQGDIIGYVGTTGRSTGPHLHYEVHLKDVAVNPQSLKIATGVNLEGNNLKRFRVVRDNIEAMRTPQPEPEKSLVADKGAKDKSL